MTAQDKAEVLHLLLVARTIVEGHAEDHAMAVWRLVDAAGLVALSLSVADRKGLCGLGVQQATGRGFALELHPLRRKTQST